MSVYTPHKVTVVPTEFDPNDVFFVGRADQPEYLEIHVANKEGTALRRLFTKDDVGNAIEEALGTFSNSKIVDTYADLDTITPKKDTMRIMVLDATGDESVDSGAANYIYRAATDEFVKTSEEESLDVKLEWSAILGRPSSTVTDIDDAVGKRHSHTNSTELGKVGQDNLGNLTYGGHVIGSWVQEAW